MYHRLARSRPRTDQELDVHPQCAGVVDVNAHDGKKGFSQGAGVVFWPITKVGTGMGGGD